jgi:hypothetical protein
MTDDPGSLAKLHDIVLPPAVAFWPPAPGPAILAIGLVGCLAIALWKAFQRYRADAYRREAAAEIARLDPASPDAVLAIFAILKRTALVAYDRESVASLTGLPLVSFLMRAGRGIEQKQAERMVALAFAADDRPRPDEVEAFASQARAWALGGR